MSTKTAPPSKASTPEPWKTVTVTLDELHFSESNVRKGAVDDKKIASLAASIKSVGLLQPIVVSPRRDGRKISGYEVIAGAQRMRALRSLAEQDPARADWPVPCVLLDDAAKFTEASLAENYAREQMRPVEIYRAFADIRAERPKASIEELGAMFGFDAPRAARIMRLANLAPEIMDLYAAGTIDDAQAQAYAATDDQALQVKVYHQLEKAARYPHERNAAAIRKALGAADRDLSSLLAYVGVDAYRTAGGIFVQDLFASDEAAGIIQSPELLHGLVDVKLAEDRDAFVHRLERNGRRVGEKWGQADLQFEWVHQAPQIKQYGSLYTDHELAIRNPTLGKLSPEEEKLYADRKSLLQLLTGVDDRDDDEEDRIERLSAEIAAIDAQRTIKLPKKGAVVGTFEIKDGALVVALWYASRSEKGLETPAGAKEKSAVKAEPTARERDRARWGLTKDAMQAMNLLRREMIREQLFVTASAGSTIAMDFVIYTQARTILRPSGKTWDSKPYLKGDDCGIATPASQDDSGNKAPSSVRKLYDTLTAAKHYRTALALVKQPEWVRADDPVDGWMIYRTAEQEERDEAAAIVAAHSLMASTSFYADGVMPRMVNELANYLEGEDGAFPWYDIAVFDENFFGLLSHKARLALLSEWGLQDAAKRLRKDESAAYCARVIKAVREDEFEVAKLGIGEEDARDIGCWRPEYLDTHITERLPSKPPEECAAVADLHQARVAEILAMDPPPAVVVADYVAFYRWDDGSYRDCAEDGDDTPCDDFTADTLEELLTEAKGIGEVYASIAEHDLAREEEPV